MSFPCIKQIGLLNIEMNPCDAKGQEYADTDDVWVNDCKELVGKDYFFVTKITSARGLPNKYSVSYYKIAGSVWRMAQNLG